MQRRARTVRSAIAIPPVVALTLATSILACGTTELIVDLPDGDLPDTAYDAGTDSAAPIDSSIADSGIDTARDSGIDSAIDSGHDSGHDSGVDTRPPPCPVAEP